MSETPHLTQQAASELGIGDITRTEDGEITFARQDGTTAVIWIADGTTLKHIYDRLAAEYVSATAGDAYRAKRIADLQAHIDALKRGG
jgi:hypothetical protein